MPDIVCSVQNLLKPVYNLLPTVTLLSIRQKPLHQLFTPAVGRRQQVPRVSLADW